MKIQDVKELFFRELPVFIRVFRVLTYFAIESGCTAQKLR